LIGPPIAPAQPPRGPLLTVLLLLVTGGSLFGIASTILIFSALHRVAERQIDPVQNVAHAKKILTVMLLASVVRLVCAGGMWMWKQWGVFGYVGLAMLQMFLESRLYPRHQYSYGHLVWVVLVLVAALPKWSQFEA
jgi:predicted exporter